MTSYFYSYIWNLHGGNKSAMAFTFVGFIPLVLIISFKRGKLQGYAYVFC